MESTLPPPPPPIPEPVKIANPNRHPTAIKTVLIISPILTIFLLVYALGRDQIQILLNPPPPTPTPTIYLTPTPTPGSSLYTGKKFTYPTDPKYSAQLNSNNFSLKQITPYPGYDSEAIKIGLFANDSTGKTLLNLGETVMAPYIDISDDSYITLAEKIDDGIVFVGKTQIYFYSPQRSEVDLLFSDVDRSPQLSKLVFSPDRSKLFSVWSDRSNNSGQLLSIDTSSKEVTIFPFQHAQVKLLKYIDLVRDLIISEDLQTAIIRPGVEPLASPTNYVINGVQTSYENLIKLTSINLQTGEVSYTSTLDNNSTEKQEIVDNP